MRNNEENQWKIAHKTWHIFHTNSLVCDIKDRQNNKIKYRKKVKLINKENTHKYLHLINCCS